MDCIGRGWEALLNRSDGVVMEERVQKQSLYEPVSVQLIYAFEHFALVGRLVEYEPAPGKFREAQKTSHGYIL
jgi:hypothetical protein